MNNLPTIYFSNIGTILRQNRAKNQEFVSTDIFIFVDDNFAVNGLLTSQLGLTVTRQTQKCIPHTYKEDLHSETLNLTIPAGFATGMSAVVITETEEGIIIETECIGKVYAPEECDKNDWTIIGEPETQIVITRPSTVELTCATIVNRLSDVINAPAGYTTTEKMPRAEYRTLALNKYVK